MKTLTWNIQLDERPLTLRIDHSRSARTLVVWVDGFPHRREALPMVLHPRHVVTLQLDGHRVEIVLIPEADQLRYELAVDGASVTDGRPSGDIGLPAHGTSFVPGQLPFDAALFYGLFPRWPMICTLTTTAGALSTLAGTAASVRAGRVGEIEQALLIFGVTAVISGVAWWWTDLQRHRRLLAWGDARPAIVVQTAPLRLAVSVDLSTDPSDPLPAIVVVDQPLDQVRRDVQIGDRAVVMAWYEHSQDGRRWHGLRTVAAECASADQAAIRAIGERILEGEWARVSRWHAAAGHPTEPGTWPVGPAARGGERA